jgi:hypothetical protein
MVTTLAMTPGPTMTTKKLMALIGVTIALSSVAAGEANAWSAKNFRTPTGNIVCHSVYRPWLGIMCSVNSAQRTIALPTYAGRAYDVGYRPLYAWRALGYGSRWTWGSGHISCDSTQFNGMRCRTAYGHGMVLARQGIQVW